MTKTLYTAEATVTGGRKDGRGKTSDGNLEVTIKIPKELGGDGTGTNPEQLFAVGYASCFESALSIVAMRKKVEADDASIDSKVHLQPGEDRGFKLAVELDVTLPSMGEEEAVELVRTAHKVCPYSNAIKGNVDVELTANGREVD
jgi:Ohr subfamily peroxiredoxin